MNLNDVISVAQRVQQSYLFALTGNRQAVELLPFAQPEALEATVQYVIDNPEATAQDLHNKWVSELGEQGFVLGPNVDFDTKQHPSMVPYDMLPKDARVMTCLLLDTVDVLAKYCDDAVIEPVKPETKSEDVNADKGDEKPQPK